MHYSSNHCFTAYDFFETFDKKQLKIKRVVVQDKYGVNKKQWLCASVLVYCFYLIILDIIENNVTFVLPLFRGKNAMIHVIPVTGNDLKEAVHRGAFSDIDLISTNFTAYKIAYTWNFNGTPKEKTVYLHRKYKELFIDHINKGKQYY